MNLSNKIKRLERQIRLVRHHEKYKRIRTLQEELNSLCGKQVSTRKGKLPPTGKLLAVFLFLNFTVVEIYSMWAMYQLGDLSSLSTLITCVIGEVLTYLIYSLKSTRENTSGGIIYDIAMKDRDTGMAGQNTAAQEAEDQEDHYAHEQYYF